MEQIKLTINGKEVTTSADKTILQVVHENHLDLIPTLCHDGRLEHYTSCFLCVVEVEGINKMIPSCSTKVNEGMKIHTRSDAVIDSRKSALELIMSNHYADCIGPCSNNCPAGVDAQAYIALISMGKYKEALKLVKENNPLPLSIGRVCVRDCETACRRNYIDEAVAVNTMKRYVADNDLVNMWIPPIRESNGKKVAVIGSGPAGLSCAYYLRLEGYEVTIFEKLPQLGGMLRYGIPEYRLPKSVLDTEIKWILDLGIRVKNGVELGVNLSIAELKKEFDSVFIGVGAHKATKLGLDDEDKIYGIFRGIDFLRAIITDYVPKLDGTVVVVGGGNTAIDAARTALRCGAEKVKIVYRRSIKEMPANEEEIVAAQHEGVEILFLTNPKSLIEENGILKGIECLKMGLIEGKPGERPKPVPLNGTEFIVNCNYLISAIGQAVDTVFASMDKDISLEKWGTLKVNNNTLETSVEGVFAGGDAVTGPFTAITSIAQGKKAAISIMNYIRNGKAAAVSGKFYSFKHRLGKITEKEYSEFAKLAREKMKELEVTDRIHCFDEVEKGIDEEQLFNETSRCLECGCSEYTDCTLRKYCDEYHVDISNYVGDVQKYTVDKRHPFISLDANKCINCGKCVRVCSDVLKISSLGFVHRGFKSVVKPEMEKALADTNCITCGNCIDVCPTGAISEKFPFKTLGSLPKEDKETICGFCSLGCKVNFKKVDDDIFYVSNSTESIQYSDNNGYLCSKGRFGYRYLLEKNRIFYPSIKKEGVACNVTEDEAIEITEKRIKEIIAKYGQDSVAVFASPKLSNEELYVIQKFVRAGLGNNNIGTFSNLETKNHLDEQNGFTASNVTLDEVSNADLIVVMNSNLTEDNLPLEIKIKEAQKNGAKLVLFSSSETLLSRKADLWVDSIKGTNTVLLNSIIKNLVENKEINIAFGEKRITEFKKALNNIKTSKLPDVFAVTGIVHEKYSFLIELFKGKGNIIFVYNNDKNIERSADDLKAINNFLLLTGRLGKKNNGLLILRNYNNSTGMNEMGASAVYLPGYITFNDNTAIKELENKWNTSLKDVFKPSDLIKKLSTGKIKAALIFGENPYNDLRISDLLKDIEFKVVFESNFTETTSEADVVFPINNHIEKSGSYVRCDNTLQFSDKIIKGILDYENWQVILKIASRFPVELYFNSIDDIRNEIKRVDRLHNYMNDKNNWVRQFYENGFTSKKLILTETSLETTIFSEPDMFVHFSESFYEKKIKSKL